jgi:hypothetical protein
MDRPGYLTDDEVQGMFDAPTQVERLPGGSVRVEKAGIVGVGETLRDAARDWGSKFAITITRPKLQPD